MSPKQCPKCWALSTCIESSEPGDRDAESGWSFVDGHLMPPSPFEDWERRTFKREFSEPFDAIFACPSHGRFAFTKDGTPKFLEPDAWVEGPNGEKLFRI